MVYARVKQDVTRCIRACGRNMYPKDSTFAAFQDRYYEQLKKVNLLDVYTQEELDEYLSEVNQEAKTFALSHWKTVETSLVEYKDKDFLIKAQKFAEEAEKAKVAELIRKRIEQLQELENAKVE